MTNNLKRAIDTELSLLRTTERERAMILTNALEGKKVKKKLSAAFVLVMILTLAIAVALAASLGIFGELGQLDPNTIDPRMNELENVSSTVSQTVTTDDGITITISQAYYDGSRVFISYEMSGKMDDLEKHEGAPEGVQWDSEEPGVLYGQMYANETLEGQEVAMWLDGSAPRWVKWYSAGLHDGLFLTDDAYLNIIGGSSVMREDGTVVGWKECEIPPELAKDELTVKAVLFRGTQTIYQDRSGLKMAYARDPVTTGVAFTVKKDVSATRLVGAAQTDVYTAKADMTLNPIDLKGTITMTCPDHWLQDWREWDGSGGDMIDWWALYAGDTVAAERPINCGVYGDENPVVFDLCFQHGGATQDLKLVPMYRESGAHIQEAMALTPQE